MRGEAGRSRPTKFEEDPKSGGQRDSNTARKEDADEIRGGAGKKRPTERRRPPLERRPMERKGSPPERRPTERKGSPPERMMRPEESSIGSEVKCLS
ncbi:hypothetical protein LINPERPRIM_LOCUS5144 [Linum perenne]